MNFICLDGKIMREDEPLLMHNNRAFRYGDGLFETLKMINGRILLKEFHFERLYSSLALLQYTVHPGFSVSMLEESIESITEKNNCKDLCRVRLTVFRGNGHLYTNAAELSYMIECSPLNAAINSLNDDRLSLGLYTDAQKSCDSFSNIKSASFLPYVMGALYAEENKLNDCLLMNTKGNICDTTIANIFLVNKNTISTPALTEGCINGVMRRYLLQKFKEAGYDYIETSITEQDVLEADELFLTNAINGIRWVKTFVSKTYTNSFTKKIYNQFIKTLFQ